MSKNEFIKRIPPRFQEKLGLLRFKISLNKCMNKTQVKKCKMFLDFKADDIFNNINEYNKETSTKYLKTSLKIFLLEIEKNININDINKNIKDELNIITIQDIIEDAIKEREKKFELKLQAIGEIGVNTKHKIDSTKGSYKAILKSVNEFFGEDFNIKNLNLKLVNQYSSTFKNNTYINHLKSIFKSANLHNKDIINYFVEVEENAFVKYKKPNVKKIFYKSEIDEILRTETEEKSKLFETLLYTGMRLDELLIIQKSNIRNNCFVFFDSKNYFEKVIPIHNNILEYIINKSKSLNQDDYLFFKRIKSQTRVPDVRAKFNNSVLFKKIDKTLHKTRSNFITYLNFYHKDFNQNDIKSLTHKLSGADQQHYNLLQNLDYAREIINSIDFNKFIEIEEQVKASKLEITE